MKRYYIFIICFSIFAGMKIALSHLNNDALYWLIAPTNKIVELLIGAKATYTSASGYFYPILNIVINKSCSGYNFFLTCFLLTAFVFTKSNKVNKWTIIPLSLLIAYPITILANTSRIVGYLFMLKSNPQQVLGNDLLVMHQGEGIFVYLTILIILYVLLEFFIAKLKPQHEKTA